MGYQVALSPSARRDLRDIVRYISTDSHERAITFGHFLTSQVNRLAGVPELGRIFPEFGDPTIRENCGPIVSSNLPRRPSRLSN